MKFKFLPVSLFLAFLCLLAMQPGTLTAQPPTHVPRFSSAVDNNINGFWEYLPRNYVRDVTQTYPLLVFIHGNGDRGSVQDTVTMRKVLNSGTPKIIGNGTFPDSFFVAGKWFKFIVISPQIKEGFVDSSSTISPFTVDAMIKYARATYRVDSTRIYLGGLSMGGGAVWNYAGSSLATARKLAAITVAAGAATLTIPEATNIAGSGLPVIATHNIVDDLILATRTLTNVNLIKSLIAPTATPQPIAVLWPTAGPQNDKHNVWTRTYETLTSGITPGGNLIDTIGRTIYEWMLINQRTASALPVVWKSFQAERKNNTVLLKWETATEQLLQKYEAEKSQDGQTWEIFATVLPSSGQDSIKVYTATDNQPYQDITYYRVKQVDLDGKFTYSAIRKILSAGSSAKAFTIYPSPFTNKITIGFFNEGRSVVHVLLSDSHGKTVKQQQANLGARGDEEIVLSGLQGLPAGVYYVRITDGKGNMLASKKILK